LQADEVYLGGFVSVYLSKGRLWSRRVRGVYATSDRIIGVQLGRGYLIVTDAPIIIAAGIYLSAFYYSRGFPSATSFLFLVLGFLPLLSILGAILFSAMLERVLKQRRPLTIEEVEEKKYFEVRRSQIFEILLKRDTAFTPGSLTVNLRLGKHFKVFIFGIFGSNERCVYGLIHLMESFCAKPSVIRAPDMIVWTL